MVTVPQWHLVGDWFDVCKCNVPCPCTFAQAPTYGDCEGVLAWHIREGRYRDVRLDGPLEAAIKRIREFLLAHVPTSTPIR